MRTLLTITLLSVLFALPLEAEADWGRAGKMVKWGALMGGLVSIPLTAIHAVEASQLSAKAALAAPPSSNTLTVAKNLEIASAANQGVTAVGGLSLFLYGRYAQIAKRDVSCQLRILLTALFLFPASVVAMTAYSAANLAAMTFARSQYTMAIMEAIFGSFTAASLGVAAVGAFGL